MPEAITTPEQPPAVQQKAGCLPPGFDANSILTTEQCATWLQLAPRELVTKALAGIIPHIPINQRVYRFHVGTVLKATTNRKAR